MPSGSHPAGLRPMRLPSLTTNAVAPLSAGATTLKNCAPSRTSCPSHDLSKDRCCDQGSRQRSRAGSFVRPRCSRCGSREPADVEGRHRVADRCPARAVALSVVRRRRGRSLRLHSSLLLVERAPVRAAERGERRTTQSSPAPAPVPRVAGGDSARRTRRSVASCTRPLQTDPSASPLLACKGL